jgi:hypothetical protein
MAVNNTGAARQASFCRFCFDNVWGPDVLAKFAITKEKLNDATREQFLFEYTATLQQLITSAEGGCWWCSHISNAYLEHNGPENMIPLIELRFQIPKGGTPRRLGLLHVKPEYVGHIGESGVSRLERGMSSEPSKIALLVQPSKR